MPRRERIARDKTKKTVREPAKRGELVAVDKKLDSTKIEEEENEDGR
jgi:hypothetical protein